MERRVKMYLTKTEISRTFKLSRSTVDNRVQGIEREIGKRYNKYAICGKLISLAVFLDYEKYHQMLMDDRVKDFVPAFDIEKAKEYLAFVKSK